jgi:molecular chaperone GrpE
MKKKHENVDNVQTTEATNPETVPETAPEQEIKMENGPTEPTPEIDPIQQLGEQVLKLQQEKEELVEKIKYSQAELVSYRMRKDEETASLLKYASQDLISELIPLIDNFEAAIKLASKSDNPEVAKYLTGFQLMYNSYVDILKKYGVEEINRVGQVFDPKQEQAMVAENHPDMEDGIVLEVLQKGYKFRDRVIRPASVKINQI